MNIVKELRKKKGVAQWQLAKILGVAQPTVSEWEANKKDPSGERLKKLAEFFEVDELVILGKGVVNINTETTGFHLDPNSEKSETEQIKEYYLAKLGAPPVTSEARILARGIDKLPKEQREQALNVVKAMFASHPELFEKGNEEDDSEL